MPSNFSVGSPLLPSYSRREVSGILDVASTLTGVHDEYHCPLERETLSVLFHLPLLRDYKTASDMPDLRRE